MDGNVDMGKVYDDFAGDFAKSIGLSTWQYVGKPALRELMQDLFGRPDARFLDLGAASGRVEADLLLQHGVAPERITGVEISPKQVAMAQANIPGATFMVGSITEVELPESAFSVAFSHMVFEHLDDAELLAASRIAHRALRPGGVFAFVVTHPSKMTHLDGSLVTEDGPFDTSAPWGGVLRNWRRSVGTTVRIIEEAGFHVEVAKSYAFPVPAADAHPDHQKGYDHYRKYPAIRLGLRAVRLA